MSAQRTRSEDVLGGMFASTFDNEYYSARSPSEDDLAVFKGIFGECPHRSFDVIQKERRQKDWEGISVITKLEVVVCKLCQLERFYRLPGEKNPSASPETILRHGIPQYSKNPLICNELCRALEQRGWRAVFSRREDGYRCTVSKGEISFCSEPVLPTEIAAVCRAIAILVKHAHL